jgi:hypothetical protein
VTRLVHAESTVEYDAARAYDRCMAAPTVVAESFRGWTDTYRVGNDAIEARVVADVGPRIVEVRRPGGRNLFHLREAEIGGHDEPVWRFRGGWRLWIAPERESTTYALDNRRCAVTRRDARSVEIAGPPQPEVGLRKTLTVEADPAHPRLRIDSRVTNVGDEAFTLAPWTLAMLRPGGRAFVPFDVGPLDAYDDVRRLILWSYARVDDPRYRFGDGLIEVDSSVVVRSGAPTWVAPKRSSDESKIGVDSVAGWCAYLFDGLLYVTRALVDAGARADGGATLEVYSCRDFIELEHLGVLQSLTPGEDAVLREDWWLFADVAVPTADAGSDAIRDALAPYVDTIRAAPL